MALLLPLLRRFQDVHLENKGSRTRYVQPSTGVEDGEPKTLYSTDRVDRVGVVRSQWKSHVREFQKRGR